MNNFGKEFKANKFKSKKAHMAIIKQNLKDKGLGLKLCYTLTYVFKIIAVIVFATFLALASKETLEIMVIFVIEGFFFAAVAWVISFVPFLFLQTYCNKEYKDRKNETIIMNNKGFIYTYELNLINNCKARYSIVYDNIVDFAYDEKTMELKINGPCSVTFFTDYDQGKVETSNGVDLLNTFKSIDLVELLKEYNCKER